MSNYSLEFIYPGLPKRLNETLRMHYHARNNYFKSVYASVAAIVRGKLPPTPLKRANITLVRCNYRTMDHDGAVGSMKPLVDSLVYAGVLADDSYKITGPWAVWQIFAPKGQEHVKVKIEEIKEAS